MVLIHGMGEQQPMETLRGFVQTVWQRDPSLFANAPPVTNFKAEDAWTEPDDLAGSTELRRITTRHAGDPERAGRDGVRLDFFELYWADLTADTTWGDFLSWFKALLWRRLGAVPPRLRVIWCLLWLLTLALGLSVAQTGVAQVGKLLGGESSHWVAWLDLRFWSVISALLLVVGGTAKAFLTAYFGDVARYVSAAPRNIKVRREARERGLKLLAELSASGKYQRIVVVGHSLGSILAHDLVWLAWSEAARALRFRDGSDLHLAVQACEQAANALLDAAGYAQTHRPPVDATGDELCKPAPQEGHDQARLASQQSLLRAYRLTQRGLWAALACAGNAPAGVDAGAGTGTGTGTMLPWLISDLVTLGSPLTHADLLISKHMAATAQLREILRCPPMLDDEEDVGHFRFSYRPDAGEAQPTPTPTSASASAPPAAAAAVCDWKLHHASATGPVRWTNIHDAAGPVAFLAGDIISGPLAPLFGPGVVDVQVNIERRQGFFAALALRRWFTHTQYWRFARSAPYGTPAHIAALRDAINVQDLDAAERRLLAAAAPDS